MDAANTNLKSCLVRGELTVGSWITLAHPAIAEIMADAGFDWLVVDLEHSVIDLSQAQCLMQAAGDCPVLVRLTANDENQIKRVMDAGAAGVLVPMVASADQARAAARAMHYPPRGGRGVGLARAQGFGAGFEAYRAWLEREAILAVMIEHVEAVEAADSILAVEEVDAWMIGPYDLSASMGRPGDCDHPEVVAAINEVLAAGRRAAKPGGVHVVEPDPDRLAERVREGFRFLGYSLDIRILDAICRTHLHRIRESA